MREAARRGGRLVGGLLLAGLVAACGAGAVVTKHGHHLRATDLQQIQPGMSQEQVRMTLGTPTTTSSVGAGDAFYYISSTTSQVAFMAPSEIDRQVVAVYFTRTGSVERIAQYGIQDGKIFDFISRTTPSANTKEDGLLKQIFRNLGKRGAIFGE
ncbi:MAG: outer membrane protein assembly factor BamE [Hyphomicrobiaceae bacterium]|nr:outer membrane protein assembly factor BamE [Hyphomicrobiaceae bacterium]